MRTKRVVDRRGFFQETLGRFGVTRKEKEICEAPFRAATVREREKRDASNPSEGQEEVQKRVAVLERGLCMAWDDQPCQLCVIRCPQSGEALYLEDLKPIVREEKCAGCGECEQACALVNARVVAIRMIPERRLVEDEA